MFANLQFRELRKSNGLKRNLGLEGSSFGERREKFDLFY